MTENTDKTTSKNFKGVSYLEELLAKNPINIRYAGVPTDVSDIYMSIILYQDYSGRQDKLKAKIDEMVESHWPTYDEDSNPDRGVELLLDLLRRYTLKDPHSLKEEYKNYLYSIYNKDQSLELYDYFYKLLDKSKYSLEDVAAFASKQKDKLTGIFVSAALNKVIKDEDIVVINLTVPLDFMLMKLSKGTVKVNFADRYFAKDMSGGTAIADEIGYFGFYNIKGGTGILKKKCLGPAMNRESGNVYVGTEIN